MNTSEVERFDRTRPPSGYVVWLDDEWGCCCYSTFADGVSYNDEPIEDEAQAIAAAWAHYERGHDAPGTATLADSEEAARAAAWAWYWRRVAVAARIEAEVDVLIEHNQPIELAAVDAWPRCLAWSDEQVSEVERWLAEGGDPPEVLR